jgi:hypothetical protein
MCKMYQMINLLYNVVIYYNFLSTLFDDCNLFYSSYPKRQYSTCSNRKFLRLNTGTLYKKNSSNLLRILKNIYNFSVAKHRQKRFFASIGGTNFLAPATFHGKLSENCHSIQINYDRGCSYRTSVIWIGVSQPEPQGAASFWRSRCRSHIYRRWSYGSSFGSEGLGYYP